MDSELNTKNVNTQTKILSVVCIIFGLFGFYPIYDRGVEGLLFKDAPNLIIEYSIIIMLVNVAIFFIIGGVLLYRGVFVSWHDKDAPKIKQVITQFYTFIMLLPFTITISFVVFQMSESTMWKTVWAICLIYGVYIFISNLRVIRSSR